MAEHHGVSTCTSTMSVQQHRGSHTTRPKIKIIHITAPEIIKTDVANFRDLVQRLTGKPVAADGASSSVDTSSLPVEENIKETVAKKRPSPPAEEPVVTMSDFLVQQEPMSKKRKIECEVKVEEGGLGNYGLDCNDLWMDLNPGAGSFLSFLEEELNAFQGLAAPDHDFLPLPLGGLVGEMYAS